MKRNSFDNNRKKPKGGLLALGRLGSFVGVTILAVLVVALGVVWVLLKGPSPYVTEMFCRSTRETSAIGWIPNIFLSQEEIDTYKSVSTEDYETAEVNTSLIKIAPPEEYAADVSGEDSGVQLIDIAEGTVKGKLLIVKDPSRIILGVSGPFGEAYSGLQLTELVAKYDGLAGTNAGGFNDNNGQGNGGVPYGMVISEGQFLWGELYSNYNVIGFDQNHILHVGTMTGQEAVDLGIEYGVSFVTHDGLASSLIINGQVQTQNLQSGVNPRTAIGQCADGSVLMLVLDGRSINTLGASMEDVCDIMLSYGAVNAGNLDGGSSSVMVYEGEIINTCASVTGPRSIPTAFIVTKKEA